MHFMGVQTAGPEGSHRKCSGCLFASQDGPGKERRLARAGGMWEKGGMKPKKNMQGTAGTNGEARATRGEWWRAAQTGDALTLASGLLLLAVCMVLPLVAKAAAGGSGSPGAGPMESYAANKAFFAALWLLTAATTGGALFSKWKRREAEGGPFPKATAGLAAVTLAIGLAAAAGLLRM